VVNERGRVRVLVIALSAITVGYGLGALIVALTSSDWRLNDTLTAVSSGAFFTVTWVFAVSLEQHARRSMRLQEGLTTLLRESGALGGLDLSPVEHAPAQAAPPVEVTATPAISSTELVREPAAGEAGVNGGTTPGAASERGLLRGLRILAMFAIGRRRRRLVEAAIEAGADDFHVRELLKRADLFVLGRPATGPGGKLGEESDILHFTADDEDGHEHVFMPVFTRRDALRDALRRNPDWQTLSVLQVDGGKLLPNVDDDVTLVIDPWIGPLERQLPPEGKAEADDAPAAE